MFTTTVSDRIMDVLVRFGVRHVYGMPGDAINDLIEAIRRRDDIQFIQVRHEEAGALAASAQAKLTGELAVCVGTSGGGAIHLLNGLYDAHMDNAPVLAITGQVARAEMGFESHQEVNSQKLFDDVAGFNATVVSHEQVPSLIEQACQHALTHSGVSHLALPEDVAGESLYRNHEVQLSRETISDAGRQNAVPSSETIAQTLSTVEQASRPVILAGFGALSARAELIEFAEKIQAGIIHSLRAKELLAEDHPLSLGGLGVLGSKAGQEAVERCDLLITVGTDFPYKDYYPTGKATIVQINNDPTRFGRRSHVDIALSGDAKSSLVLLLKTLSGSKNRADKQDFLKSLQGTMNKWRKQKNSLESSKQEGSLNPKWVANELGKYADDDAVFVCDTGAVTAWAAKYLPMKSRQRFTLSANLGTMSFGFSGAMGAKLAYPNRQVIALVGDGGFGMLMQDFLTAVKYKLPVKVIVFNNEKLGLIQMEQEAKGNPESQTALHNLDFAAFAKLCGGQGWSVKDSDQFAQALNEAMHTDAPCVIDLSIDPSYLVKPPKVELGQAVKFSIAKVKEMFTVSEVQ